MSCITMVEGNLVDKGVYNGVENIIMEGGLFVPSCCIGHQEYGGETAYYVFGNTHYYCNKNIVFLTKKVIAKAEEGKIIRGNA